MFDPARYADMPEICRKYGLFPAKEEWRGRILLLESSEEQMAPAKYKKALEYLKDAGVFAAVSGVLVGRPMDGVWQAEYEQLLRQVIDDPALPVVCGLNVGHALPALHRAARGPGAGGCTGTEDRIFMNCRDGRIGGSFMYQDAPKLVIMAAGMGSRFGGLKQMEPVDDEGHSIIDFFHVRRTRRLP